MHSLLLRHDAAQQKATARAIGALNSLNREAIASSLNTLDFWGGEGSIIDLILTEIPWTAEFRRDALDDGKLTMLELDLINEMESLGIANPGVIGRRAGLQFTARYWGLLPSE
jgi:hypothetical protein